MKRQMIVNPLVLAVVLAGGTAVAWATIVLWTIAVVQQEYRLPRVQHSISVQGDGTPLVQKIAYGYRPVPDTRLEYFSLDGDPIERDQLHAGGLAGAHLWQRLRDGLVGPPDWTRRVSQFHVGQTGPNAHMDPSLWYFIHDGLDDGSGYFVGYELVGNRCIGYLGVNGLSQERPSRGSCFSMSRIDYRYRLAMLSQIRAALNDPYSNRQTPILIRSRDQILEVDLEKRSVRTVFQGASLLAIAQLTRARTPTPDNKRRSEDAIAVRMPDKIAVITLDGEIVAEHVLPESIQADPPSQFYTLPNGQALFVNRYDDRASGLESAKLTWSDADGNLLDRKQATLGPSGPKPSTQREMATGAVAFPAPGIMVTGIALMGAPLMEQDRHPEWTYAQAIGPGIAQVWPVLLALVILGSALSWICVRRQKKYGLSWTKTWVVFVFLFGIPGYLAYLCHRRWPVRAECAECQTPAPRDRDACTFCDTPFPAPAPKGVEVFA